MNAVTQRRLAGIDTARLAAFRAAEEERFVAARSRARALAATRNAFLSGAPMHWMTDWPMPFPIVVESAEGARLADVDGHAYADFCLGDTAAMFGHSPPPVARALAAQAAAGFSHMLPAAIAGEVGERLASMFGLPVWQIALTATDANRFALRAARAVTGRSRILVFNGCYHGTVDETFVRLKGGRAANRPGMVGEWRDLAADTAVVEFNDLAALEAALASRDVACVITEPVLTNSSMVLPEPGFHDALRRLTREAGTLLLIDETHTISSGFGGYTGVHGLAPDLFVCGKAIAGGVPAAVWGMTAEIADAFRHVLATKEPGHSGMGTTLSANALSMAALRANLAEVMTRGNYARMEAGAARLAAGLSAAIAEAGAPWHVARVGARVEFIFAPVPLRDGTEAEATHIPALEAGVHLGLVNRGVLIAPFHNMMLVSPATTDADVDRLVAAFRSVLAALADPR
jgi:glutamate-1-semialdehyde 2,1-aminomutase